VKRLNYCIYGESTHEVFALIPFKTFSSEPKKTRVYNGKKIIPFDGLHYIDDRLPRGIEKLLRILIVLKKYNFFFFFKKVIKNDVDYFLVMLF